jgi:sulfatase modifying factor 1
MPSKPHRGPEDPADAFDVFISYARPSGLEYANALRDALAARGRRAFVDESNFALSNGLEQIIDAAMGAAKVVVVVVSSETAASPFQQAEVQSALRYSRNRGSDFVVIPWRVAGGPGPDRWPVGLAVYQGHDSAGLEPEPAAARLVALIADWLRRVLGVPMPPPPAPPLPPQSPPHFPPAWAVEWGDDEYGPYASLAVQRVIQRMRWCPPGRFMMGPSPEEAAQGAVEGGRQEVSLAHGFWMADTPVTLALFREVMGAHPSAASPGDPSRPVTSLRRQDAVDAAVQVDALLAAHEPSPGRLVVRLPTEAEWEYACRAGTKTLHYLGSDLLELDKIAWHMGNARGEVQPVARLLPNSWGLFDTLGNVWEWCLDDSVGPDSTGRLDKPAKFPNSRGWARGGGCSFLPHVVSPAVRWEVTPAPQERELGLRLCIGPPLPDRA